jgi:hypothetical protein
MSLYKLTEDSLLIAAERVWLPNGSVVTADSLSDGWRTIDIDPDAKAAPAASLWEPGKWAEVDALYLYSPNGYIYRCRQRHPMQSDWTPPLVPALFLRVNTENPDEDGVLPWIAGEAVRTDDLRSYDGVTYRCLQGHTTQEGWQPPNVPALWAAEDNA